MPKMILDSTDLVNPKAFGYIISYYMYDADIYELNWDDCSDNIKLYFNYLDQEERKQFVAHACKDTGIIQADYKGDRFVTDGIRSAGAPLFYKDNVWLFTKGESLRFMIDLEDALYGEEDEYDNYRDE